MKKYFILIISLSTIFLGWVFFIAPHLLSVPSDFLYKADIVSRDNFYNEQTQTFSKEKRSITKFSYEISNRTKGSLIIKNTFDVRQITGEKIFAVERLYGIDPKTGKHVASLGDRDRDGYLFAPKNLQKDQSFTYWHINYDGPALMTFVGEEYINDLHVYRYETKYEGVKIDQTKNLTDMSGVGITRGVELEPYLQVWVEPVSGHLVKYQDDTIAYYYDLKTGQKLNPWNHFSNSYTLESVFNHVELAKQEKFMVTLVELIIPKLLVLITVFIALFYYRKNKVVKIFLLGILAIALFILAGIWFGPKATTPKPYNGPLEKIRLGAETGLLASSVWVAEHNGYFKEQGLDVEIKEFSSGRAAMTSMLEDGNLDMVTVAQTPFVFNSFNRNDYVAVAGMVSSPNDVKIIARKDKGINSSSDLKGKKIGITKNSTGNYFLSLFLSQHSLGLADVTIVDFETSLLVEAIKTGQVDAIASWEPYIYKAKNLLESNALILESNGTFREDFYFTVFKEWAKNNSELLKRYVKAIEHAEDFIEGHPKESQQIVAERLKIDPLFIKFVWSDYDFHLFLDQAMLLTFEQQARWMIANNIVTTSTTPNYLDFIYFDALEAIKPANVSIIH